MVTKRFIGLLGAIVLLCTASQAFAITPLLNSSISNMYSQTVNSSIQTINTIPTLTGDYCTASQNGQVVSSAMNTVPVTFTAYFNKEPFTGRVVWKTAFDSIQHNSLSSKNSDTFDATYNQGTISSTVLANIYGQGDVGSTILQTTITCSVNLYDAPVFDSASAAPTQFDPSTNTSIDLSYVLEKQLNPDWSLSAYLYKSTSALPVLGPIKLETTYGVHDIKLDTTTYPTLKTLADGKYNFGLRASNAVNVVTYKGSDFTVANSAPIQMSKTPSYSVGSYTPVSTPSATPSASSSSSTPSSSSSDSSSSSSSAGSSSSPTSTSTSTSTPSAAVTTPTSSDTTISTDQTPAALKASVDILTCKGSSKTLYFVGEQPASDMIGMNCLLKQPGVINAGIYSKAYDPKNPDNSANLIKKIKTDEYRAKGQFYVSWDGYDDTDQVAPLDDYVFEVDAKPDNGYSPDISLQKFTIADVPGTETAGVAGGASGAATNAQTGSSNSSSGQGSLVDQTLHGAAGVAAAAGSALQNIANTVMGNGAANGTQAAPKEPSKCPGVFYPTDIGGSVYESVVKAAYDLCIVKGYDDGTFRPEQSLTRAEATKIVILASGHLAKPGCYNNSCGSPFTDLDMWQGPWVRAAWDVRIVSGVGAGLFAPNRMITRAEAVALIVKGFGIAPHTGCYTANCGAGFPNNLFADIMLTWEGQYLRALWDAHVISPDANNNFQPDTPVTRGQIVYWIMKLVKTPAPAQATGNGATVVQTPSSGGTVSTPVQ